MRIGSKISVHPVNEQFFGLHGTVLQKGGDGMWLVKLNVLLDAVYLYEVELIETLPSTVAPTEPWENHYV